MLNFSYQYINLVKDTVPHSGRLAAYEHATLSMHHNPSIHIHAAKGYSDIHAVLLKSTFSEYNTTLYIAYC